MDKELSRRALLGALAAGPAVLPALGANEKLNVGWIGTGSRGMYVMAQMYTAVPDQVVAAVCDTYAGYRARAKDKVQTKEGKAPKVFIDYKELLADPSIDAVVIATPEHLHHDMTIAALRAGKHVYIEKPLSAHH
jgi:predicted dehydrogenase